MVEVDSGVIGIVLVLVLVILAAALKSKAIYNNYASVEEAWASSSTPTNDRLEALRRISEQIRKDNAMYKAVADRKITDKNKMIEVPTLVAPKRDSPYAKTRKTVKAIVDTWWPLQKYNNYYIDD